MLAVALLALSGWVIPGEHLIAARQFADGSQQTLYGPATLHDVDDARLGLETTPKPRTLAANATVHGVPAELGDLTDDGQVYGREVAWIESGRTFSLGLDGKPSDARMLALAESVQAVSPQRWHALRVATGPPRRTRGMRRVVVVRGHGWKLTALIPKGFPVAPEDRRVACIELAYRGQRDTECDQPAAWRRVGGKVFVFGELDARIKRVRIAGIAQRTGAAPGYPLRRFYAARLPSDTCTVAVHGAHGLRTGPAAGGPEADRRRCLSR
jgi:hypothetical protein